MDVMVGELGMASVVEGESSIMAIQDELASATLQISSKKRLTTAKNR